MLFHSHLQEKNNTNHVKLYIIVLSFVLFVVSCSAQSSRNNWDSYIKNTYPNILKTSAKVIKTNYYEGVELNGEWICGHEMWGTSGYNTRPKVECFNKAGNIILEVNLLEGGIPFEITETEYISPESSLIKSVSKRTSYSKEVYKTDYIRDENKRLIKIKSSSEETVFEYNSKGEKSKITETRTDGKTITTKLPNEQTSYLISEYYDKWKDNYKSGLKKERIVVYDNNDRVVNEITTRYDEEGRKVENITIEKEYKNKGSQIVEIKEKESYDMLLTSEDNAYDSLVREYLSKYNDNDDIISYSYRSVTSKPSYILKYQSNGTVNKVRSENRTTEFSSNTSYQYKYNSHGDWVWRCEIPKSKASIVTVNTDIVIITVRDIEYK